MDKTELIKQYDRFIDQLRTEVKDLYWLYNFFFLIESAMSGALLSGRVGFDYMNITKISGLLLAFFWFVVIRKQRLWRNEWVRRIQRIETELGYSEEFKMWRRVENKRFWKDYIFGRKGLWRCLFSLPIFFVIFWTVLIIFY